MEKTKMNKTGRLLIGILIGGLIGVSMALLMAPQSGERLRAQIRDKSAEIKDKTVDSVKDMSHQVEDKVKSLSGRTEEKAKEVAHKANI